MMPPLLVFSISFPDSFWFCIQSLPMPCHEWNGVYANWRTSCLQSTLQWSASINNRGFGTTTLTNQSCRSKRHGIPRLKVQLIFVALCVGQTKLKITPSMVNASNIIVWQLFLPFNRKFWQYESFQHVWALLTSFRNPKKLENRNVYSNMICSLVPFRGINQKQAVSCDKGTSCKVSYLTQFTFSSPT